MSENLPNEFLVKIRFTLMTNLLAEDYQEGVIEVDDGVLEETITCLKTINSLRKNRHETCTECSLNIAFFLKTL